jgi:CheY-like chemotaxis protein
MSLWGARVVAIDEDLGTVDLLRAVLRAHGAQLVAVSAPGEALTTVLGVMPDVLLVDVAMEGEDTLALIRKVRTLSPERGGRIPAAVVTACPATAERIEAWRRAGFQAHLAKPFAPECLVALVDTLAGRAVERRTNTLERVAWPGHVRRERRQESRDDAVLRITGEGWPKQSIERR